ncbi:hypothetical protein NMY22_g10330 [Coprinellus aureogranulatus]|nr:hypothetical protein NMY22_g10330 [Coprinellus aureogranulatus]
MAPPLSHSNALSSSMHGPPPPSTHQHSMSSSSFMERERDILLNREPRDHPMDHLRPSSTPSGPPSSTSNPSTTPRSYHPSHSLPPTGRQRTRDETTLKETENAKGSCSTANASINTRGIALCRRHPLLRHRLQGRCAHADDRTTAKGRGYVWGVAEGQERESSGFKKLCSLLIWTQMLDLIPTTVEELHYESYGLQQIETRKSSGLKVKKMDDSRFKEQEEALRKKLRSRSRRRSLGSGNGSKGYVLSQRMPSSGITERKRFHMIIDESPRMENTKDRLAQTLTTYHHSRYRPTITGTPLQNNFPELPALLDFVLPKNFISTRLRRTEEVHHIRCLHKGHRWFMLECLKKDIESKLPDKVKKVFKVGMSALRSQLYNHMEFKTVVDTSRIIPITGRHRKNQKGSWSRV